jgi:hypothetical protein
LEPIGTAHKNSHGLTYTHGPCRIGGSQERSIPQILAVGIFGACIRPQLWPPIWDLRTGVWDTPRRGEGGVVATGFDVLLGTIWNRLEPAGTIWNLFKTVVPAHAASQCPAHGREGHFQSREYDGISFR